MAREVHEAAAWLLQCAAEAEAQGRREEAERLLRRAMLAEQRKAAARAELLRRMDVAERTASTLWTR
jgi:hypothetical protein